MFATSPPQRCFLHLFRDVFVTFVLTLLERSSNVLVSVFIAFLTPGPPAAQNYKIKVLECSEARRSSSSGNDGVRRCSNGNDDGRGEGGGQGARYNPYRDLGDTPPCEGGGTLHTV